MQRLAAADSHGDQSSPLPPPSDQWKHLPPRIRHQKAVQFQQQRIFQSELWSGTASSSSVVVAPTDNITSATVVPSTNNINTISAIGRAIDAMRTFLLGRGGGGEGSGKGNWKGLAAAGVAVLLFALSMLLRRGMGQQRKLVESVLQRGVAAVGGPSSQAASATGRAGPALARLEI